jgi:hypothetical protein
VTGPGYTLVLFALAVADRAHRRWESVAPRLRPLLLTGWQLPAGIAAVGIDASAAVIGAVGGEAAAAAGLGILAVLVALWCLVSARASDQGWTRAERKALKDHRALVRLLEGMPEYWHEEKCR